MKREVIHTAAAPKAVGPYSQAVKAGPWLYVSGQIPMDPSTGQMVEAEIAPQARRALENLKAIILAAGFRLQDAVKCSCFLQNMDHFSAFNSVYAEYFPESPPARECVQVARLPRDVLVEVSAICWRP